MNVGDWISQQLTALPLYLQLPLVLIVLVPAAGVGAWALLWIIDLSAAYLRRWFRQDTD